jgi:hypothetical protein
VAYVESQVVPRNPTEHLLVSAWGVRWTEVNVVMAQLFTAFIDDSGTDPLQQVAIASALVIPASRIQKLQVEWDIIRLRDLFPSFHMSEFSSPTPPKNSHFRGWTREKHDRVYRQIREVIKDYGAVTVSFAVYKKDYDEVVPPELRQNAGRFHYTWAVRHLVAGLEKWRRYYKIDAPFEFIFDHMPKGDERRIEIENVMDQNESLTPGLYSNYSFRQRERFPGLQCVDVLGWISYQFALHVFCDRPIVRDAEIGWDDFESYSQTRDGWRLAATLKRSELERWVKLDKEQGLSQLFFDDWNQKKQSKRHALMGKIHTGPITAP